MSNSQIVIFLLIELFMFLQSRGFSHKSKSINVTLQWFSCVKTSAFDPMGADELLPCSEHKQ